jgi:hypothetical protein
MNDDPTPSSASCVQSIVAATAPAASPTSVWRKSRAAISQNTNPRPIVETFPTISVIEFASVDSERRVGPASAAGGASSAPRISTLLTTRLRS